jgi:DNA repair exonuclease SbcCD ATPase subunit
MVFICFIICCIITFCSRRNLTKNGRIDNAAGIVVTIGVLFTFIGITISLYYFDSRNIQESIPMLLEGMKTAFFTSIIGMLFSIVIKNFQAGAEYKDFKDEKNLEVETNVLLNNIKNTNEALVKAIEHSNEVQQRTDISIGEVKNSLAAMSQNTNDSTRAILTFVQQAQNASPDTFLKNFSGEISSLNRAIQTQSTMIANFVKASQNQSKQITNLMDAINANSKEQSEKLQRLNRNIEQMIEKQSEKLSQFNDSIKNMADLQEKIVENSDAANKQNKDFNDKLLNINDENKNTLEKNNECINNMVESFDKFLEDMAKNNSEQFIKALSETIKDFNAKLTEQFGDNFKELNIAVGKMLEWQKDYKDTVEISTQELRTVNSAFYNFANDMPNIVKSLNDVIGKSVKTHENISADMVKIMQASSEITSYVKTLEGYKNSIETLSEDLIEAKGKINKSIIDEAGKMSRNFTGYAESLQEQYNEKITETNKKFGDLLYQTTDDFKGRIDKLMSSIVGIVTIPMSNLNISTKKLMDSFGDLEKTIETYDDDIEKELKITKAKVAECRQQSLAVSQDIKNDLENLNEVTKNAAEIISQASGDIKDTIENNSKVISDEIREHIGTNINLSVDAINEFLKPQLEALNKASTDQIEKLGAAMLSITTKMIENYEALVSKINEVDDLLNQKKAGK